MTRLTPERARAILSASRDRRILVLGDVMLDEFVWGTVTRISPEAPVPVVEVVRQSFHLGGAANVSHNIRRLGAAPLLVGVVGRDLAGQHLRRALAEASIPGHGLVEDPSRPTTTKTRIIAQHQQVVRADRESRQDVARDIETQALAHVTAALDTTCALVISDYNKGLLTARFLEKVISLARRRRIPVLVDPKPKSFASYRGISVVTPNVHEAAAVTGVVIDGLDGLTLAAKKILSRLQCRGVLITRGEQGMSLFEKGKRPLHVAAASREVFDVTGAGDTVVAAAAVGLAGGARLDEVAILANQAAGIVVGKLGTSVVGADELLGAISAGNGERR